MGIWKDFNRQIAALQRRCLSLIAYVRPSTVVLSRHLSSAAMLLALVSLSACAGLGTLGQTTTHAVETREVMVMPAPTLGAEVEPGPMPTVPPVAVTTIEMAKYYIEACEAWMEVDKQDVLPGEGEGDGEVAGLTREQVEALYPETTRDSTCSWALYGWPAESQLDFEKMIETLAGYTDKLRERVEFLKEQLISRHEAVEKFNERTMEK